VALRFPLKRKLGTVLVPENPDFASALGAALNGTKEVREAQE